MGEAGRDARRTFGPVVLLGLAGGGSTAIAGGRAAAEAQGKGATAVSSGFVPYDAHQPLVSALGLVVLACWGVVLVTRGRVRRAVAALGALASAGAVASAIAGWSQVPDRLRSELAQVGVPDAATAHTAWWWVSLLAPVLALVAGVLAVRLAPAWPEMGARYDAPAAASAASGAAATVEAEPGERSSLDLWKAIDEGHDPTAADPEQRPE
jgi:uncharacterized membrane protein (TIGR02234 family)